MSVTSLDKDAEALTLTVVAEFEATVDRVWELFADPRRLERWWGPPGYPATFVDHDLTPGGSVTYYMTSPEGEKYHGYWTVTEVAPPTSFAFTDGFADGEGRPNAEMPTTTVTVTLAERDGGTRLELVSQFDSREDMEQLTQMGMDEGLRQSMGQMDAVLAA